MQMVISNVYTMLHTNLMNKRYLNIIGGLNLACLYFCLPLDERFQCMSRFRSFANLQISNFAINIKFILDH